MSNTRIARRYAEAFLLAAEEQKTLLKKVGDDFLKLRDLLNESHELQLFLKSPVIKTEKKQAVLAALFEKKVQPLTFVLLQLLAEKGRESSLPEIIETFFLLRDEKLGIMNVHVKTAVEFTRQQKNELEKHFELSSKKKVQVDVQVDPALIGGFVARMGDTLFDGSIKRQLELLRQRFAEHVGVN
jgi:F-type H+-transporting ATPase subunit delta